MKHKKIPKPLSQFCILILKFLLKLHKPNFNYTKPRIFSVPSRWKHTKSGFHILRTAAKSKHNKLPHDMNNAQMTQSFSSQFSLFIILRTYFSLLKFTNTLTKAIWICVVWGWLLWQPGVFKHQCKKLSALFRHAWNMSKTKEDAILNLFFLLDVSYIS